MDGVLRLERGVLLGFVTVLGATVSAFSALAGLVISLTAGLAVCAMTALLPSEGVVPLGIRWSIVAVTGFVVSWILGSVAAWVVPLPQEVIIYLRLSGVAPIVFYAVAKDVDNREALLTWIEFAAVLVVTGVVRELLGKGTVFGYLPGGSWVIPADFFATPVGAFLVPAALILAARILHRRGAGSTSGGVS